MTDKYTLNVQRGSFQVVKHGLLVATRCEMAGLIKHTGSVDIRKLPPVYQSTLVEFGEIERSITQETHEVGPDRDYWEVPRPGSPLFVKGTSLPRNVYFGPCWAREAWVNEVRGVDSPQRSFLWELQFGFFDKTETVRRVDCVGVGQLRLFGTTHTLDPSEDPVALVEREWLKYMQGRALLLPRGLRLKKLAPDGSVDATLDYTKPLT